MRARLGALLALLTLALVLQPWALMVALGIVSVSVGFGDAIVLSLLTVLYLSTAMPRGTTR